MYENVIKLALEFYILEQGTKSTEARYALALLESGATLTHETDLLKQDWVTEVINDLKYGT